MSDVITGITPSAPRRMFGTGVLYALGGLLIYLAIVQPPSVVYALFLVVCGGMSLFGGWKMWQVTGHMIELTEDELRLSDGTLICKTADIQKVDRSFFAFKPSNGFLMTLKAPYPRAWAPGLLWRFGRRIGIGGVLPGAQTKVMADMIAALIASRDGAFDDLKR